MGFAGADGGAAGINLYDSRGWICVNALQNPFKLFVNDGSLGSLLYAIYFSINTFQAAI